MTKASALAPDEPSSWEEEAYLHGYYKTAGRLARAELQRALPSMAPGSAEEWHVRRALEALEREPGTPETEHADASSCRHEWATDLMRGRIYCLKCGADGDG